MFVLTSSNIDIFCSQGVGELFSVFKNDFMDDTLDISKNGVSYSIDVKPHITCTCPFASDQKPEKFWQYARTTPIFFAFSEDAIYARTLEKISAFGEISLSKKQW